MTQQCENQDGQDLLSILRETRLERLQDPARRENNMEWDLVTTDWILEKTRSSDSYAQNLYAALCNNKFQKLDIMPILKNETWSCSWRYAGGIIADMQQKGDYLDWYCSGIKGGDEPDVYMMPFTNGYASEGSVTDEVRADLLRLGWTVVDDER